MNQSQPSRANLSAGIKRTKDYPQEVVEEGPETGSVTATPIRDESKNQEEQTNIENNPEEGETVKRVWWKIALAIGVPVSLLLIGVIITLAVLLPRDTPTVNITTREVITFKTGETMETSTGTITSPDVLGSSKPVSVSVDKVAVKSTGRKLQEENPENDDAEFSASVNVHDHYTGISVKFHRWHFEVRVPIHHILEYIFDHQKHQEHRNEEHEHARLLTETASKDQENKEEQKGGDENKEQHFNFFYIEQKLVEKIHQILKGCHNDLTYTLDGILHKNQGKNQEGYEIVEHPKVEPKEGEETEEVNARLHDPANTPQIKDYSNEDEVADAISKIVKEVVDKAKALYDKHIQHLKKQVGQIRDDGKDSAMSDKATDVPHMCETILIDKKPRLRCLQKAWSTGVLKVVELGRKDEHRPTPTALVAVMY